MSGSKHMLRDSDLPGMWADSDHAAARGQRLTLCLTGTKIGGGLLAALGGFLSMHLEQSAWLILAGFLAALIGELALWVLKPETIWYEGRLIAESAKNLTWRYAVCADPFPHTMSRDAAKSLFGKRISAIADRAPGQIVFETKHPVTSPAIDTLRAQPFARRRNIYIRDRFLDQKSWYAKKARSNRTRAHLFRLLLIVAELFAVVLAGGMTFDGWQSNSAGLLAAIVTAGTAWVAIKQFSPLATTYALALKELAIAETELENATEEQWPQVVAFVENTFEQEHSTWLASRSVQSIGRHN